jgi:hypothetical protein
MQYSNRKRIVIVLSFLLLVASILHAQNKATGDIRGTITDTSGAVIPGVTITLIETSTQSRAVTTANERGLYVKPYLPPGVYTLTFEKAGFRTLIRNGIDLHVGDILRVDAVLEVGAVKEFVSVTAEVPLVEAEKVERAGRLTAKQLTELPTVGRDELSFLALMPGVSYGNAGGGAQATDRVNVSGQRAYTSSFVLDGGAVTFPQSYNLDYYKPALDTIAEINISTTNFSAEYGNGGAVFNTITKSGTNEFHGAVYEFTQNDALGARNFFASQKGELRWNQFGANLGGPIRKDKLFFFFSYQGDRQNTPVISNLSVPTAAMKQGNFAGFNPIYDPSTTVITNGKGVRQPFPNNVIPETAMDAISLKLIPYWSEPNRPGNVSLAGITNNRYDQGSQSFVRDLISLKMDYNLSSANRLTGTFVRSKTATKYQNFFPGDGCSTSNCGQLKQDEPNATVTDTWTLTPTVVNEMRMSFITADVPWVGPSAGKDIPGQLGLKNVGNNYFPSISISNISGLTGGRNLALKQGAYTPANTTTWVKGRHILKFGGEYRRSWVQQGSPINGGSFGFSQVFSNLPGVNGTGLGFADFLTGLPQSFSYTPGLVIRVNQWSLQSFAADDFKVTPKLTLNLGVRWMARSGWGEDQNRISNFDPNLINPRTNTPGATWYADQNGRTALTDTRKGLFAPRLGLAWVPFNKLSIRAGYGIFYMPLSADAYSNQGPAGYRTQINMLSTDNLTPIFTLTQGPPAAVPPTDATRTPDLLNGQSISWWPTRFHEPYTQQWHLTIQRELKSILFEAAYAGTKGVHLLFPRDMNQLPAEKLGQGQNARLFPQYLSITSFLDDGNSIYHSLQLQSRKQFSQGLTFLATYTFSKNIDDSTYDHTGTGGQVVQIWNRTDLARGLATSDVTHRATGAFVYELPVGHGRTYLNRGGFVDAVLGGWQMSGVLIAESGLPFTVGVAGANLSNSLANSWLPNRIGNGNLSSDQRSIARWFDTSAFVTPAQNTFGNTGRNVLRGPGFWQLDYGLAKNFAIRPLGESTRIQFRADAFNVFNHTNFNNPSASVGNAQIGIISSAKSPRNIQLGLKVLF